MPGARWIALAVACMLATVAAGCWALRKGDRSPWGTPAPETTEESPTCRDCHSDIAERYDPSPHARKGIQCGQCHRGAGHPRFDQPLDDGTCGGCHQPEYEQILGSAHRATARVVAPEGASQRVDGAEGFRIREGNRSVFVARGADPAAGRLCAGCHYDGHRFSLAPVREAGFCTACHRDREEHYASASEAGDNRCLDCHVREGKTVTGQVVNSHAFRVGAEQRP